MKTASMPPDPPRGLYIYQHKVENNELFIAAGVMPTLATPNV